MLHDEHGGTDDDTRGDCAADPSFASATTIERETDGVVGDGVQPSRQQTSE